MNRDRSEMYALCFAQCLPSLKRIAQENGYALGVHGSMRTDLDLIACPWTDEVSEPEVLIEAIRSRISGVIFEEDSHPTKKPHGRLAWRIHPHGTTWSTRSIYFDISVVPKGV